MSRAIAIATVLLAVTGCSTSPDRWTKSDVPRSQADADLAQCRYQAKAATASYRSTPTASDEKETGGLGTAVGDGIVIAQTQVDLTNDCMRARGYVGR